MTDRIHRALGIAPLLVLVGYSLIAGTVALASGDAGVAIAAYGFASVGSVVTGWLWRTSFRSEW